MSLLTLSFIFGVIGMVLFAIWMLKHSKEAHFQEQMLQNFREVLPHYKTVSGNASGARQTRLQQLQIRASIYAGFELTQKHAVILPVALLFTGMVGWMIYGLVGAMLTLATTLFFFGFLLPYSRLRKRQAQTIAQIPLFIDQVLRSLSTGRSLESAIRFGADESRPPLRYVLDRVIRASDLGADMVETLGEASRLHQLRELNLVALAMRISNNYGSSPRDMLDSVVKMVRQQEQARRELSSMTGETRMSAWVLGLTPLAIAGYIMVVNPSYLDVLLEEESGKTLMITALSMQAIGAFILWRMLRSV